MQQEKESNQVMTIGERTERLLRTRASLLMANAKMTARCVALALESGLDAESINEVLREITDTTKIAEIYVTGAQGNIEFGSHPGQEFRLPTDPDGGTQAAPFARLLEDTAQEGTGTVVIQDPQPRELDRQLLQYVGVSGIARRRIVQVGIDYPA